MPLNLYRRHYRAPGKCVGGHPPDSRSYEPEELRRNWKKCYCPIYADGTLGGKFKRRNTKKASWPEAKAVAAEWEARGSWDETETPAPAPALARDRLLESSEAVHHHSSSPPTPISPIAKAGTSRRPRFANTKPS
jgi:hypothetical protein